MAKDAAAVVAEIEAEAAKGDAKVDYDQVKADLDRLRNDLGKLKDSLKNYGANKASQARSTAEAQIADLQTEIERLGHDLRLRAQDAAGEVERRVHERPFQSLLIAAAVGWILAHLFGRR